MDKYIPFLVIGAVFALIIVGAIFAHKANKKRMAALAAMFGTAGFSFEEGKDSPGADSAFGRLGAMRGLKTGSRGVKWHATGENDGIACTMLEHRYTTGSGKNQQTHYHTIAACPAGNWPVLELGQEHFFHKVADAFGYKDIQLEDPEFNKAWRVKCKDENFALLALGPEVQAWIKAQPKGAAFKLGDGAVCVYKSASVPPDKVMDIVRAATALRRLLPSELDAYTPV